MSQRYSLFRPSIARPPSPRERETLIGRLRRLEAMEESEAAATRLLRGLVEAHEADNLRIRHGFIRAFSADSDIDTSDRNASDPQHRPPCTRSMSPRGSAVPFILTALLDAQLRTPPGQKCLDNPMPIRGDNNVNGWTDYIATDAQIAAKGKVLVTVRDKKVRQIHSSLTRLAREKLVYLPNRENRDGKYEGFLVMREDARRTGDNDIYGVPDCDGEYFTVPLSLFANGWIHVLEDSELALLLITARMRAKHGGESRPLASGPRKLNYGLSRDSFEAAHRMLEYLGIIDVVSDYARSPDGKVENFRERGAQPHQLLFHPESLEKPALATISETIKEQLAH